MASDGVIGLMESAKWWNNPQFADFLMKSKQMSMDEDFRRDSLAQQKSLSDRELAQREKQFEFTSQSAIGGMKIGTEQARATNRVGLMQIQNQLDGVNKQISSTYGPPSPDLIKKRDELQGSLNIYKENDSKIESIANPIFEALNKILKPVPVAPTSP